MIYKSQDAKLHTLRLVNRKIGAICKSSCAFLKLCLIRRFAFFLADCRLWEVVKTKIWSEILKTLIIPDRHSPRVYLLLHKLCDNTSLCTFNCSVSRIYVKEPRIQLTVFYRQVNKLSFFHNKWTHSYLKSLERMSSNKWQIKYRIMKW